MMRTSIVVDTESGDRERETRGSRWSSEGQRTWGALELRAANESQMVIVGQHSERPHRQA